MRSLIDILELSLDEIEDLIATANDISKIRLHILKNAAARSSQRCSSGRLHELG